MAKNKKPTAEEPTPELVAAQQVMASATPIRNFWAKPAVAIAGVALASGIMGFAIGSATSHEEGRAGISGEGFGHKNHHGMPGMQGNNNQFGPQGGSDQDGGNWMGGGMPIPPGQGFQGGQQRGPGAMMQPGQPGQLAPGQPVPVPTSSTAVQ